MAERKRGLPPSFDLNVPQSVTQGPVQLGDYLDEEEGGPVAQAAPRPNVPSDIRGMRAVARSAPLTPPTTGSPQPVLRPQPRPAPRPPHLSTTVPRKQVNMTPETLRMVEALLNYVQTYSVQKDAKASELFHGLVLALYEAREHLDFSTVQPRGRWGTPTAAAFPIALKNAFQAAIADWHSLNQP